MSEIDLFDYIPTSLHAAIIARTSTADVSSYIQAAITAAAGRIIRARSGRYFCASAIQLANPPTGTFTAGVRLIGDGPLVTEFETHVANDALFTLETGVSLQFTLGSLLESFSIMTNAGPAGATGIKLQSASQVIVRQIFIEGLSGNGIEIPCLAGDADGSTQITIEQCRIQACAGWGIKANATAPHNEISFLRVVQSTISGCGTNSDDAQPPSGGMIWKGQVATLDQVALVINENVGLYIPGEEGLANNLGMRETTFENNKKRGFYSTGIHGIIGRNLQFYNNDAYVSSAQFELEGTSTPVARIDVNGVVVRATAPNNAIVAFKISGGLVDKKSCRVRNVSWQNFDHAGQTRFSGWVFDAIPIEATLVAETPGGVLMRSWNGSGGSLPLRLRGTGSTSGEWVEYQLGNGVARSNSGLTASTAYYGYFYDNNGTATIDLSTTAPTIDLASGYAVKTGDATQLFVGGVTTDAAGKFNLAGNGWLNSIVHGRSPGSQIFNYLWTDATGDVRISPTAPASDTAGTVVGTQT